MDTVTIQTPICGPSWSRRLVSIVSKYAVFLISRRATGDNMHHKINNVFWGIHSLDTFL
jgi:hypothetical protein